MTAATQSTAATRRRLPWPLIVGVTAVLWVSDASKPLVIDDPAFAELASWIADHPTDPYGFEVFWFQRPQPAVELLAPPVFPYWLAAFTRAFGSADLVCVVGSDVPGLGQSHVIAAFEALDRHDVVFGPAADGGYYLVALARRAPELFADISWSTAAVLSESEARARALGLSVAKLAELDDVDTIEDVANHPELRTGPQSADA